VAWEATSSHLAQRFREILSQEPLRDRCGLILWRLIVGHPWYQAQLRRIARRLTHDPSCVILSEDIEHEALLYLARTLKRSPDLRFDPNQPEEQFSHWMRRIILRDCQQALRRLLRNRDTESLTDQPAPEQTSVLDELRIDLQSGLALLPFPERFIVEQYLLGHSFDETATQLEVSLTTVRRRFRRGLSILQQVLD
jgi:RNA polymerase sigma factor (sigma-70 family)